MLLSGFKFSKLRKVCSTVFTLRLVVDQVVTSVQYRLFVLDLHLRCPLHLVDKTTLHNAANVVVVFNGFFGCADRIIQVGYLIIRLSQQS